MSISFNINKFNIGKFNIGTNNDLNICSAKIFLNGNNIKGSIYYRETKLTKCVLNVNSFPVKSNFLIIGKINSNNILEISGKKVKNSLTRKAYSKYVSVVLNAKKVPSFITGISKIYLKDATLELNDELIIDLDKMTISLNGQNAMKYFAVESDFFKFLKGDNEIIFNFDGGEKVNIGIMWQDAWI